MRGLFLRVFVLYLATTLALIGIGVVTVLLTDPDFIRSRSVSVSRDALIGRANAAVKAWQKSGAKELAISLDQGGVPRFLLDTDGNDLTGRKAPQPVTDLALRARSSSVLELDFQSPDALAAFTVKGDHGAEYVFVSALPRERRFRFFPPSLPMWVRIGLGLATATFICVVFANYVTSPLVRLRAVTRDFASGNLQVRVGTEKPFHRNDEFADLARDFDYMAARIQQLLGSQQRVLIDISHELRSPLTRLLLALEIARNKAGPGATIALDRIEQEAERLNSMIGQVLTLASTEKPHPRLMERFDLGEVVGEIVEDADFEASAQQRHVTVETNGSCMMHANRELIRSAIENVVRNAIRYTPEGTSVTVAIKRISTTLARITVSDAGPGVPPEDLPHLFKPFYRVAASRDRATGGSGLGLAITQHAVLAHGGSVRAVNRKGSGLDVEIHLPLVSEQSSGGSGGRR